MTSAVASASANGQPPRDRPSHRPLVYVTRRIPQKGVETLLKVCDIKQWDSELCVPRGELLHSVGGVEGLLCLPSDNVDVDVLNAAGPSLRVIATISSDTGHIDMDQCRARGVKVIACPSQPTDVIAELTVALVLQTMRESLTEEERQSNFEMQTPDLISDSSNGLGYVTNNRPRLLHQQSEERLAFQWTNGRPGNTNCLTWKNIAKKTYGVYGQTKLGLSVVKLLKTLGVEQVMVADCDAEVANSNYMKESQMEGDLVPFETLLRKSDVICVCGSVGEQSENVFCRESFKKMQSHAILVTSQSEERAIDYVDLYEALRDGQVKAAGLNDCNQEPVPFKTPLLGLKNCVFLPQTQDSVFDMRHKVSMLIAKNLIEVLNGTKKTSSSVNE